MAVFIASDHPLSIIPWNADKPAFHVAELSPSDEAVRQHFTKPYVYYTGSHSYCGCGFQLGEYPEFKDDERTLKQASLKAFADYLADQLEPDRTIELFACWEGDQAIKPQYHRRLTPDSLRSDDFYFQEHELSAIVLKAR